MVGLTIAALIAWILAVPVMIWALAPAHSAPTPRDLVLMIVLMVVPLLLAASGFSDFQRRRLAPILANAQFTTERITYSDMRSAMDRATSPRQARWLWISSAVSCVAFAGVLLVDFVTKHTLLAPLPLLFAFLLVMNAWQAVRWYRIGHRTAPQQG